MTISEQVYYELSNLLLDEQSTLPQRFRALFSLKNVGTHQAIDIISRAFKHPSALLKHELAYVLGQMGEAYAIPVLERVLCDKQEDSMVRHEAAEALGAIGRPQSLKILKQYLDDEREPLVVRQTCQLAIAKIEHEISNSGRDGRIKRYGSIDPAPAFSLSPTDDTIEELKACLLDRNADLFLRYRAMFTLRDIGTAEAVLALAEGLKINGEDHALFRHEIAYIFGQMQHAASVPALKEALKCTSEAPMVRHECAEALGSIASDECLPVLDEFKSDQIDVVRDSCLVALDMWEYEQSGQFQYAFTPN